MMKKFLAFFMTAAMLFMTSSCVLQRPSPPPESSESETVEIPERYALYVPDIEKPVSIVHSIVKEYYDALKGGEDVCPWDYTVDYVDGNLTFTDAGRKDAERVLQSKMIHAAAPVTLRCHQAEDVTLTSISFLVATDENFSDATHYEASADGSVSLLNLYPNTRYYYKAIGYEFGCDAVESNVATFTTEDAPRFLNVPNLINTRDIGGYTGLDGKTVKYGMVLRGSELDGLVEPTYKLTEDGKAVMLDTLGIQYDMDLRGAKNLLPPLGDGVEREFFTMRYYSEIFEEKNMPVMGAVLKEFADPDNYPIFVHCTYGADRTGTVCFLLEALLGVEKDDLMMEYSLTGFAFPHVSLDREDASNPQKFLQFIEDFEKLSGDTYAEKAETYCRSVGLTDDDIEAIRSLLLEK